MCLVYRQDNGISVKQPRKGAVSAQVAELNPVAIKNNHFIFYDKQMCDIIPKYLNKTGCLIPYAKQMAFSGIVVETKQRTLKQDI